MAKRKDRPAVSVGAPSIGPPTWSPWDPDNPTVPNPLDPMPPPPPSPGGGPPPPGSKRTGRISRSPAARRAMNAAQRRFWEAVEKRQAQMEQEMLIPQMEGPVIEPTPPDRPIPPIPPKPQPKDSGEAPSVKRSNTGLILGLGAVAVLGWAVFLRR